MTTAGNTDGPSDTDGCGHVVPGALQPYRVLLALRGPVDVPELVRELLSLHVLPVVALTARHALDLLHDQILHLAVLDAEMLEESRLDPAGWNGMVRQLVWLSRIPQAGPVAGAAVVDASIGTAHISVMIHELLRSSSDAGTLAHGLLTVDLPHRRASWDNIPLRLSPAQLRLLAVLVRAGGAVVSRADLARRVLGASDPHDQRLEMHLRRLRKELRERAGADLLLVVRGEGLRLADYEPAAARLERVGASPTADATRFAAAVP